jgi:hypothetical protein
VVSTPQYARKGKTGKCFGFLERVGPRLVSPGQPQSNSFKVRNRTERVEVPPRVAPAPSLVGRIGTLIPRTLRTAAKALGDLVKNSPVYSRLSNASFRSRAGLRSSQARSAWQEQLPTLLAPISAPAQSCAPLDQGLDNRKD